VRVRRPRRGGDLGMGLDGVEPLAPGGAFGRTSASRGCFELRAAADADNSLILTATPHDSDGDGARQRRVRVGRRWCRHDVSGRAVRVSDSAYGPMRIQRPLAISINRHRLRRVACMVGRDFATGCRSVSSFHIARAYSCRLCSVRCQPNEILQ
jgi:hypothetical protein